MTAVVTVNDVLDGHVGLDVECLDRIYLNGYVPNLQVAGQVVSFMTAHLGNPIPSPAILEKIGIAFRKAVDRFAADNKLPVVGPRLGVIGDSPGAITEAGQQVKEVVGFPVQAEGRQADRATATTIVRRG